jgi:NAD(P)-dependent dehydrogenase (short-subunit alcohol dehydrogenase family)
MAENPDPDQFTTPFLLTKTGHRDPYPAISLEKPENSQKGKVIIITGASAGIGAAAAKVWARAGASGIVIAARRLPQLEDLAKEIKSISPDTKVLPVKADILSEEDVKNLYAVAKKTFGRPVDVVVNNASYLQDEQLIGETPASEWWKVLVSFFGLEEGPY